MLRGVDPAALPQRSHTGTNCTFFCYPIPMINRQNQQNNSKDLIMIILMLSFLSLYVIKQEVLPLSAPLEVGEFWGRGSCQDMHVDVRSWQSISVAVREKRVDSYRLPCWWTLACNWCTHARHPAPSAFYFEHFAEMLNINTVFQTQSALFLVFSSSLSFPLNAPATALRCFKEAETLKALIWRSPWSRWDLSIG